MKSRRMRAWVYLRLAGFVAVCAWSAGCADPDAASTIDRPSAPAVGPIRDRVPADFQLSVTVMGSKGREQGRSIITPARAGRTGSATLVPSVGYGSRGVSDVPIGERPARYVIEADWVLRAAVGQGARETFFPMQTRQLDAAQVSRVWRQLSDSGLTAPGHSGEVSEVPRDDSAPPEAVRYIVSYAASGVRRSLVFDAPVSEGVAGESAQPGAGVGTDGSIASARALVEVLAHLAWLRELPVVAATDSAEPTAP